MKKSEYQKFLDFKKRHNLTTKQIQEMIREYANTGPDTSCSYFIQKYDISEKTFYRARDFAIICGLVSYKTQERVIAKAAFNSSQHNSKKSASRSLSHSQELKRLREAFFNSFSKSEIVDICQKYAEGMEIGKIAICYDTGEYIIKNLLAKGVILKYIDENILEAISIRLRLSGRSIEEVFRVFERK